MLISEMALFDPVAKAVGKIFSEDPAEAEKYFHKQL